MKIQTPALPAEKTENGPLLEIAGARYRPAVRDGDPDLYQLVGPDKVDEIINDTDPDRQAMHVLASTEERVRRVLRARHPAPPGGTMLWRADKVVVAVGRENDNGWRRRLDWIEKPIKNCFIILDKPLFEAAETVEQLQALSQEHGPILITEDQYTSIWKYCPHGQKRYEQAEQAGFTVLERRNSLWQVNYNPKAFELRGYRQVKNRYLARTSGSFPKDVIRDLFIKLSPSNWPSSHPFDGVVSSVELEIRKGWGHTQNLYPGLRTLVKLIELNRKLLPEPWYRHGEPKTSRYYQQYSSCIDKAVEAALPYIHGVEEVAHLKLADARVRCKEYYQTYLESCRERWDLHQAAKDTLSADGCPHEAVDVDQTDQQLRDQANSGRYGSENEITPRWTEEEYIKHQMGSEEIDAQHNLKLCRWLRREAKALKLKLPAKPVQPLSPAQLRERQKARKKRAKARKKGDAEAKPPGHH